MMYHIYHLFEIIDYAKQFLMSFPKKRNMSNEGIDLSNDEDVSFYQLKAIDHFLPIENIITT